MELLWTTLLTVGIAGVAVAGTGRYVSAARRRQHRRTYPAPASLVINPVEAARIARQPDGSLLVTWSPAAPAARLYAGPAPDAIDRTQPVASGTQTDHLRVPAATTHPRLYFELARDGQPPLLLAERILTLEGVPNVRDIGGYPAAAGRRVRWGRVYRTGSLAGATDADLDYLSQLGLKLVCDLRTTKEVDADPDRLPQPAPIYQHLPVDAGEQTRDRMQALLFQPQVLDNLVREGYTRTMIDRNGPVFGAMLRALADPVNLPAAIHCTAGKDRTGVTIALLLAALGVPDDIIIADYTLSNHYYSAFRSFMASKFKQPQAFLLGLHVDDLQPLLSAPAAVMQYTLGYIRQHYGSIEQYLEQQAGVNAAVIAALRTHLLE
jgi:protein-tyrosine phosphatase